MIDMLRRRMNRMVMWAILGVTFFAMVGTVYISLLFKRFSRLPVTMVAEVNGYEITQRELNRKVGEQEIRAALLRQYLGVVMDTSTIRKQALDTLIQQKLLFQLAAAMGIYLDPSYVAKQLDNPMLLFEVMGDYIPPQMMMQPQAFKHEDLVKVLKKQGTTAQCFEEVLGERLSGQMASSVVLGSAYVPKVMISSAYNKRFRPRTYSIVTVAAAPYHTKAQERKVDDATLRQFYVHLNQQRRYWKPERRIGTVWNFSNVSATFITDARTALGKGPDAFEAFVKEHNGFKTPISVSSGTRKDLLSRKLFTLGVGQYGIESEKDKNDKIKGYVIKLEKIEPSAPEPFETVKDQVRKDYDVAETRKLLEADLAKLKEMSSSERVKWIEEHKAPTMETEMLSPQKMDEWKQLTDKGIDTNRLFMLGHEGETTTVIGPTGGYFVMLSSFGPVDEKEIEAQYQELIVPLFNEERMRIISSFIASLEKNATIKTNDETKRT